MGTDGVLGRACVRALGADGRGDDPCHDRRRGRAVPVGAAALALSDHLHPGVQRADLDPAELAAEEPAGADGAGGADACARHPDLADGRCGAASVVLLRHGDDLPRAAVGDAPGGGLPDALLFLHVARRRARRHLLRAAGAERLLLDRRVSDPDRGGRAGAPGRCPARAARGADLCGAGRAGRDRGAARAAPGFCGGAAVQLAGLELRASRSPPRCCCSAVSRCGSRSPSPRCS